MSKSLKFTKDIKEECTPKALIVVWQNRAGRESALSELPPLFWQLKKTDRL